MTLLNAGRLSIPSRRSLHRPAGSTPFLNKLAEEIGYHRVHGQAFGYVRLSGRVFALFKALLSRKKLSSATPLQQYR